MQFFMYIYLVIIHLSSHPHTRPRAYTAHRRKYPFFAVFKPFVGVLPRDLTNYISALYFVEICPISAVFSDWL